ncbi:MAG: hypothetical protein JJE45_06965 [Prolixibacteraceae bacterium]|nr:hypothetical protein [Prolixibacteraceae bacterium]
MDRQSFLLITTSSQWVLFMAMILIIYSWAENKDKIRWVGDGLFFLLGIFSSWVLITGQIIVPVVLKGIIVPPEAKAIVYFKGLNILAVIGLIAFLIRKKKKVWQNIIHIILLLGGLAMFFMVYHLQKL